MAIATQKKSNGDITVFCLNLRFGLADDGPHSWEFRKHVYPTLLRNYPADFYAFQEANDCQTSYLNELLDDYDFIGRRCPAPDGWQNNIIFYHRRWACRDSQHFYLSDTPDVPSKFKESQWPRQCTLGTFQRHHFQLTVVNTHLDFNADVQRKSAKLIIHRLNKMSPNETAILMGDLNAGPTSSCIEAFTSLPAGFKSAFCPHPVGTYHGFKGTTTGEPIDWILYRGDVDLRDSNIEISSVDGIFPSDHFPLVASFSKSDALYTLG